MAKKKGPGRPRGSVTVPEDPDTLARRLAGICLEIAADREAPNAERLKAVEILARWFPDRDAPPPTTRELEARERALAKQLKDLTRAKDRESDA